MKPLTALSILLMLGAGSWIGTWAQVHTSDEETVRKLDDQERTAALKRDVPALERLWSDRLTVNAPNNAVVIGKRAVMDTFLHSGIINFSSFERKIEFTRIDGDFAFIMGLETLIPIGDAPSAGLVAGQEVKRRFTNIWKKEAGTWRLFARHANVIPQR
jgi:ketosteroid isomerase-like protein